MNAYLPNPRAIVGGRSNCQCLAIGALNFPVAFTTRLLSRAQHFWHAMSLQAWHARKIIWHACTAINKCVSFQPSSHYRRPLELSVFGSQAPSLPVAFPTTRLLSRLQHVWRAMNVQAWHANICIVQCYINWSTQTIP